MNFTSEEFFQLSQSLEIHHAVFHKLWNLGKPQFTNSISTAAVLFNKIGECVDFLINPEFWKKLTFIQKQFVICHECLHVILNHGLRIKYLKNPKLVNQVLDVVVNHSLINKFNFKRNEVDPDNKFCWTNTVFKEPNIPNNKSFEYYYNLLLSQPNSIAGFLDSLDSHDYLPTNSDDIIKKLNEELSNFDKYSLKDLIDNHYTNPTEEPGNSTSSKWIFVNPASVFPKRKWETVIKKWTLAKIKEKTIEQWSKVNRRLMNFKGDLFLPNEVEDEWQERDKIEVFFFQDTSGSCKDFAQRFFTAAKSLPEDRFNVRLHCFDTQVYPTTLASGKLYGFGGTTFSCIENYIQSYIKKHNINYPEAVFCLTDGIGNNVFPEKPERWYWFLSRNFINYIPKESKVYMLKDFE